MEARPEPGGLMGHFEPAAMPTSHSVIWFRVRVRVRIRLGLVRVGVRVGVRVRVRVRVRVKGER